MHGNKYDCKVLFTGPNEAMVCQNTLLDMKGSLNSFNARNQSVLYPDLFIRKNVLTDVLYCHLRLLLCGSCSFYKRIMSLIISTESQLFVLIQYHKYICGFHLFFFLVSSYILEATISEPDIWNACWESDKYYLHENLYEIIRFSNDDYDWNLIKRLQPFIEFPTV